MKSFLLTMLACAALSSIIAQNEMSATAKLTPVVTYSLQASAPATPVKSQDNTGTCWCFSTTSLVESQCLKNKLGTYDLSEMYSVRNIYIEKAKNYLLRQGHAQFGEGGLGHDLVRAIATYGAMPEEAYSGLKNGEKSYNHGAMVVELKQYLDNILKLNKVPEDWLTGYTAILDKTLGTPPSNFTYNGKQYTPKTFAKEAIQFKPEDYVNFTSFTDHPYYQSFIISVPDNFSNGAYYNLPLKEMITLTEAVLKKGYSVLWDADVSNNGFMPRAGVALNRDGVAAEDMEQKVKGEVNTTEGKWSAERRQELYENLTTQDDHLMHITGIETSKDGKTYFLVKNSWGVSGPYEGYINVSEAYFAINTISLVIPKAALDKPLLDKISVK